MKEDREMLKSRYPNMVQEYYVTRVREIMRRRRERIEGLRTRVDAERYVAHVRRAVRRAFGPMPPRTPLNARTTGRDRLRHYDLEKVVFESRPGFLVTGNLYLPRGLAEGEKRPAVLGLCGHSATGKAEPAYQSFCQGLVARGFVVFIIDPMAQGERPQFYPRDGRRQNHCEAHNLLGNKLALLDDFFGSWRAWDAIRGLDYLLSRPEADPSRVGVTGNSGGGTLSTYVAALDPRPTMAAPSCYVCSYQSNLENELPADAEQNPPRILACGLDQADLLLCHAPRPTMILSQYDDFFDERAARRAHEEVRRVHALLGSRNSAEYFMGPRAHGYHRENREAMCGFFLKHAGLSGDGVERHVKVADEKSLWALPGGDTGRAGSRRALEFIADDARTLAERRGEPSPTAVARAAAKLLGVRLAKRPPHYRHLRLISPPTGGARVRGVFAVETEPGIQALVTAYGPGQPIVHPPRGQVTLYVGHTSAEEDVLRVAAVKRLARGRKPFVTVDPRGLGQSQAKTCGCTDFFEAYGSDYLYAATGEMLGESLLGRRVFDVLRVVDFLLANGADSVRLMGRGLGSVICAFVALLHPSQPRVKLIHYLPDYQSIIDTPLHAWPLSSLLRGCLRQFDLPDVYRALGKRLTKSEPWDARMRPIRGRR